MERSAKENKEVGAHFRPYCSRREGIIVFFKPAEGGEEEDGLDQSKQLRKYDNG